MKKFIIFAAAIMTSGFVVSCGKMLDVHNPNYFTDDEMAEYMASNPEAEEQVLTGLTGNLYSYINIYNAAINGGFSNNSAYESNFELRRFFQSGDVVEGDALNHGSFSTWYQNLATNTYWISEQEVQNYGYYYAPVLKVGVAQKALDFLTKERCTTPSMKSSRAQALTMKALAYMMLMERYTDLDDVKSTTKQGWPVYDAYAYNSPQAPLSVADTWKWINDAFTEAVNLFHEADPASKGYTKSETQLYDIDCAVCQYYRCRAAIDSKEWDIAIEAGNELLQQLPELIKAEDYGMPASLLASVNLRKGVDAEHPNGTAWNAEFSANMNAFYNQKKNPEIIYGNGGSETTTNVFWSLDGMNTLRNGPSGYYQVDKNIYDALSDADCRKACILPAEFEGLNIFSYKGNDTTWFQYKVPAYTSLKWAASCGLDQAGKPQKNHCIDNAYANNCYLRSSAVLLMTAEAYAQSTKDGEAKNLLNKLLASRTLPGNPTMTCDNTMAGKTVLDMVKLQWRIEMWGEGDWAFFNQKRWKESFTRGANHWSKTGIPAEGWTWQIPQRERQGNPYWN